VCVLSRDLRAICPHSVHEALDAALGDSSTDLVESFLLVLIDINNRLPVSGATSGRPLLSQM